MSRLCSVPGPRHQRPVYYTGRCQGDMTQTSRSTIAGDDTVKYRTLMEPVRFLGKMFRSMIPLFVLTAILLILSYLIFPTRYVYVIEDKLGHVTHSNLQENNGSGSLPVQMSEQMAQDEEAKKRSDMLKESVKRACTLLNITLPVGGLQLSHIHVDDKRKLLYCFVPKVACTSWKRIWMKLLGLVGNDVDINTIDRFKVHSSLPSLSSPKYKDSINDILKTYKKFMFTRHPFDRVLSAYKDKLQHRDKRSGYDFHKMIGRLIEKKYRGNTLAGGQNVTFPEFIRYISEPGLGSEEQRNEHWMRIYRLCNPCSIDYDFIGKYENIKQDAEYVLRWMGVADFVGPLPYSDRPFHARRYEKNYFDQLTHDERLRFFSKFFVDFLVFDYEFL